MANPTFTRIVTEIRPNDSVLFYDYSEEEVSYRQRVMIDSGCVLSENVVLSDDQLTRTTTTTFRSYDDRKLLANDEILTAMNFKRVAHNRINFIKSSRKGYEGDDASLAMSADNLVARYSSNDYASININEQAEWKETNRSLGTQPFNIEGKLITVGKELLFVDHLAPVGNFTYDDTLKTIILGGDGYFSTQTIEYSTFADIDLIDKSFFISFIPAEDSFSERKYLMSKISADTGKGWCAYYEPDGSICLKISSNSSTQTYSTPAGLVNPNQLNTVGITASLNDNENSVRIFVNGQLKISGKHGVDNPNNFSLFCVGANNEGEGNLKGKLYAVRVYYRTLDNSEFDLLHRLFIRQLEN